MSDDVHTEATQSWVAVAPGAAVALCRREGPGEVVLLVHGISSNHHFWDLEPSNSLAVSLHGRGMDVWNLDLRGHGNARRLADGRRVRGTWDLDDLGTEDLAGALAHVRAETGAERVHVVVHSLGGVVLAAMLAHRGDDGLASVTVVASPLAFTEPDPATRLAFWMPRLWWARTAPSGMAARLVARGPDHRGLGSLQAMLFNLDNSDPDTRDLALQRMVSPLVRKELRHLARSRRHAGRLRSWDGGVDYAEGLGSVRVPALVIAGRGDHIVSPDHVWSWFEAVGSADKRFVVLGRAWGFQGDYGHLDYAAGRNAPSEVYPLIAAWITEHRISVDAPGTRRPGVGADPASPGSGPR